jgi:oligosaccharide repeat unit polymerase
MIAFISFAILFFLIISLFVKETDILSPARLFLIIWSLAVGLSELKFSRFQFTWSFYSWLILAIALGGVLLGMYVIYVINFNNKITGKWTNKFIVQNFNINSNKLFHIIIILSALYAVSFYISYLVVGYLPIFSISPGLARLNWGIFGFGLIVQSVPAILFMIVLYFFYARKAYFKKALLALLFLFVFFSYFLLLQRLYLVFFLILAGLFWYYKAPKVKIRTILFITAVIVLIVYVMSTFRASKTVANLLYLISEMKFSKEYAIFTEPYMYIVMNLENFANSVNKLADFTYGYYSFDFILALTGIKHMLAEYNNISDLSNIITSSYNTSTMFFVYFRDFGAIGLGLISFIIGMVFNGLYLNMKKNPTLQSVTLYLCVVFLILFSFFVPMMHWLHFVMNVFLIYFISKAVTKESASD